MPGQGTDQPRRERHRPTHRHRGHAILCGRSGQAHSSGDPQWPRRGASAFALAASARRSPAWRSPATCGRMRAATYSWVRPAPVRARITADLIEDFSWRARAWSWGADASQRKRTSSPRLRTRLSAPRSRRRRARRLRTSSRICIPYRRYRRPSDRRPQFISTVCPRLPGTRKPRPRRI